ncbi:MAG: glycosyltransferase [Hyphomicrobiaceae bacterium]|nr:glycosyltransferase [Hyphomicrobiaceae bacterium]
MIEIVALDRAMAEFETDLSIILNVSNERSFVAATLRSLAEAISFAQFNGWTAELIVVLDNSPEQVRQIVQNVCAELAAEFPIQIIDVELGSLGPARNAGVAQARGGHITTADADDLVSFNLFSSMLETSAKTGDTSIIVPEYYFGFGQYKDHIYKMYPSRDLDLRAFFDKHPYVSRIMAPRELFATVHFADTSPGSGFAFGDWHFNANALAAGYRFEVALQTLVFYRLRPDSLMSDLRSDSAVMPFGPFFDPDTFLSICSRSDLEATPDGARHSDGRNVMRSQFRNDAVLSELIHAANAIDPQINGFGLENVRYFSNLTQGAPAGHVYEQICRAVAGKQFTDVWLTPFLSRGGAERFIADIIGSLGEIAGPRRVLVICNQDSGGAELWDAGLPEGSAVVDLVRMSAALGKSKRQLIDQFTLRLLQIAGGDVVLHLSGGHPTRSFLASYGKLIDAKRIVYYRFCDTFRSRDGFWESVGNDYANVAHFGHLFTDIISDHRAIIDEDAHRLGFKNARHHCVYAKAEAPSRETIPRAPLPLPTLIWAARLDMQKAPDLLLEIAAELERQNVKVRIEVHGKPVLGDFDVERLSGLGNLEYRGGFDDFSKFAENGADGYLYTSYFDGLPNTVIEAIETGLPIIAPRHAGIAELVDMGTGGFLVDPNLPRNELVAAYVENIKALLAQSREERESMTMKAAKLLSERHLNKHHVERVAQIFADDVQS